MYMYVKYQGLPRNKVRVFPNRFFSVIDYFYDHRFYFNKICALTVYGFILTRLINK